MSITNRVIESNEGRSAAVVIDFRDGVIKVKDVLLIEAAKKTCDQLYVLVQSDYWLERVHRVKPVPTTEERLLLADSIKKVDYVMLYDRAEPTAVLEKLAFVVWPLDEEVPSWAKNAVFVRVS